MKKFILLPALLLFASMTFSQSQAKGESKSAVSADKATAVSVQKVEFQVEGMFCTSCEKRVQALFTKQAGVKSARVSYEGKHAVVEYDPGMITPGDMKKGFENSAYTLTLSSPGPAKPAQN